MNNEMYRITEFLNLKLSRCVEYMTQTSDLINSDCQAESTYMNNLCGHLLFRSKSAFGKKPIKTPYATTRRQGWKVNSPSCGIGPSIFAWAGSRLVLCE